MLSAILLLGIAVILSLESIRLCKLFPWSPEFNHLHWGMGAVLAPFIWGLTLILAMSLTPGSSGMLHLILSFIFFFLTTRGVAALLPQTAAPSTSSSPAEKHRWVFVAFAAITGILFLLALTTTPLTQNDGLEYLIVGKFLFQTHDIFSYPLVSPEKNPLNFYGPWTHPPLYPALLYAANLIQGGIHEIGLTRWISPWFYLSSVFLIAAVTWRTSKNLSLLSFALCLSVPLWSLGATTALIDACTLSAYIALFVAVCALKPDQMSYPLIVGMISGFGMWAHSQAILNPLVFGIGFLFVYRKTPFRYIKNCIIAGGIAILIGGIYYVRNTVIFGNPIKDASPVAQIAALDMNPYFMVSRGYYHFVDVVRFGYLKMWFNYEAYNLIPWVFLFTLGIYFCAVRRKSQHLKKHSIVNLSLFIILGLFASIVAISLLGTTHYIKNERYQMILLPLMICFAMQVLAQNPLKSRNAKLILQGLVGLTFALSLAGQLLFLKKSWGGSRQTEQRRSFTETTEFLHSWKDMHLTGKVLSYKPADSFLNDIPTTSHVDPVLIPLYQVSEAGAAWEWLKANEFDYIYVPTYIQPTEYNTALIKIIGNPVYTKLVGAGPDSQLYQINASPVSARYTALTSTAETTEALITLGGRKDLIALPADSLKPLAPVLKYLREWTQQRSETFSLDGQSAGSDSVVLKTILKGFGRVSVHAVFLNNENRVIGTTNVADIALMDPKIPFNLERQLFAPSESQKILVKLKSRGLDYLEESKVEILTLNGATTL